MISNSKLLCIFNCIFFYDRKLKVFIFFVVKVKVGGEKLFGVGFEGEFVFVLNDIYCIMLIVFFDYMN